MKKLTSILALVLCVIMLAGVVCLAAETTPSVKPSVERKQAPDVKKIVVIYSDGSEAEMTLESIIITSYAQSQTDVHVSKEIKENLYVAYIEVTAVENLGELAKGLDEAVKKINSKYTDGLFVVTDLFDIWISDGIRAYLENGGKIRVTFNTKYVEKPVILYREHDGNWEVIDPNKVSLNEFGNVSVEFTSLSTVAFLSPSPDREVTPAAKSYMWIWIIVIIIVTLILVLIILLKREKDDDEEEQQEAPVDGSPAADAASAAAVTEASAEEATEEAPAEEAPKTEE